MSYNDDNYNLDFNSHIAAEMCVEWIRDWFENNGNGCKAVIGISGGKDSALKHLVKEECSACLCQTENRQISTMLMNSASFSVLIM